MLPRNTLLKLHKERTRYSHDIIIFKSMKIHQENKARTISTDGCDFLHGKKSQNSHEYVAVRTPHICSTKSA